MIEDRYLNDEVFTVTYFTMLPPSLTCYVNLNKPGDTKLPLANPAILPILSHYFLIQEAALPLYAS
jgi:hypothetical protein